VASCKSKLQIHKARGGWEYEVCEWWYGRISGKKKKVSICKDREVLVKALVQSQRFTAVT
jgi:hypothetical protein